jgi:hypothetical protein
MLGQEQPAAYDGEQQLVAYNRVDELFMWARPCPACVPCAVTLVVPK